MERLHKDYVDFYLLHALDRAKFEKVKALGIVPYLEEMRAAGKIRYLGFSFHDDYEVFEEILNYYPWDFCQIQLNYMDTEIQAGMKGYDLAEEKGIPVIVMEPVKGGMLASLPTEIEEQLTKERETGKYCIVGASICRNTSECKSHLKRYEYDGTSGR